MGALNNGTPDLPYLNMRLFSDVDFFNSSRCFMRKANLRALPGKIFENFECSVCKTRISCHYDNSKNAENLAREQKAAIFKLWDEHLYAAHRRQWEFQKAKRAKIKNKFCGSE